MGVITMERANRTAYCKNCGSTELKIIPDSGKVSYVCTSCDSKVEVVHYEKYETLYPICKQCNNDIFKVRIEEGQGETSWNARCSKCDTSPEPYYINEKGEPIDQHTRQRLIIEDSISGILHEITNLKYGLNNLAFETSDLAEDETINDDYLDGEEEYLQTTDNLSGIEGAISNIEKAVTDIQNRVKQL
jgi:DNA-directed RNA polymerase subunit RPC12/RpoP